MITLKHPLGPGIPMSEARVYRFIYQPLFFVYEGAFALTAALWNPHTYLKTAPILTQFIFWAGSLPIFALTYTLINLALLRICQRLNIKVLWETLIMSLTMVAMFPYVMVVFPLLGVETGGIYELVPFIAFCFALFEIGAFGYLAFADRVLFPEVYATCEEAEEDNPQHELFLRGTDLPIAHLEMICAVDEGIEAYGSGKTHFVKRRFGLVISELPVNLGLQIHRSVWISRRLAGSVQRDGRNLYVSLSNGKRLPVARSRITELENWISTLDVRSTERRA